MRSVLLLCAFLSLFNISNAQCAEGEIPVTLDITIDPWGEETYWEIVPAGNGCGDGTLASGSNDEVGCTGIAPDDGGEGYPDNSYITEGPFCLVDGESYTLIFVDSYGDGGLNFQLTEDGNLAHVYYGSGHGNSWTFEVGNSGLPLYDSPCSAAEVIPDGGLLELNNENAIAAFFEPHPATGNCQTLGVWCASDGNVTNSVWAWFVAESGVNYEISTCNSEGSFDTQLAVYHATDCGDFDNFSLITANDDMIGGCGLTDVFASTCYASCLIPGDTYYIQVDGWGGSLGTTHLSVATYEGNVYLSQELNNVQCPLDKGEEASGSIFPFVVGEGNDFSAEWSGPNGFSSDAPAVYDLEPGVYELVLTTACGVQFEADYEIFQPEQWTVSLESTGPDCEQSGNGNVSLDVEGATAPYTYEWNSFNFYSESQDLEDLDAGTYHLTIIDNNGCTYDAELLLMPEDNFEFDLGDDTLICMNDNLFIFGPPGLTYLWQDGSTNQFYQINASEWSLGPNALVLTAETMDGCSYTDAYVFEVSDCTTGIQEFPGVSFSVYPNPVNDVLHIISEQRLENASLVIYDATGKAVYSMAAVNGFTCVLEPHLAPGVYSLRLEHGGVSSGIRILKN